MKSSSGPQLRIDEIAHVRRICKNQFCFIRNRDRLQMQADCLRRQIKLNLTHNLFRVSTVVFLLWNKNSLTFLSANLDALKIFLTHCMRRCKTGKREPRVWSSHFLNRFGISKKCFEAMTQRRVQKTFKLNESRPLSLIFVLRNSNAHKVGTQCCYLQNPRPWLFFWRSFQWREGNFSRYAVAKAECSIGWISQEKKFCSITKRKLRCRFIKCIFIFCLTFNQYLILQT